MIQVSDTWKRIARNPAHLTEYKLDVSGQIYESNVLESFRLEAPMFDKFSIGNACSAELDVSFYPTEQPPRMAKIVVYVRVLLVEETSEWIQRGVFYISERSLDPWGRLNVTAYDSMLKAEQPYIPDKDYGDWPRPQSQAVTEIATLMGVEVDPRTQINSAYQVQYLPNADCREILGYIAASHGGNWIMTNEDKLLLVKLSSLPVATNYLVTENQEPILFGGVRLLV